MVSEDKGSGEAVPRRTDEAREAEEAKSVYELFDSLAREDHDAYEQILSRNVELRKKYGDLDRVHADLREAFAEGPDLIREKYPEVMAEVDAYFETTLTRMARRLDVDRLRDLFEAISHSLVSTVLEHIGEDTEPAARMKAAMHLCHPRVLNRFLTAADEGKSVRVALIDELAEVFGNPDIRLKVEPSDLQTILSEILEYEDVVDQYYGFEACVEQIRAA